MDNGKSIILLIYQFGVKTEIDLSHNPFLVGRKGAKVDFDIDCDSLSRKHVHLYYEDHQVKVKDLGTTNGTYINANKIKAHKKYPLSLSDELRLGKKDIFISYRIKESSKSPPATPISLLNQDQTAITDNPLIQTSQFKLEELGFKEKETDLLSPQNPGLFVVDKDNLTSTSIEIMNNLNKDNNFVEEYENELKNLYEKKYKAKEEKLKLLLQKEIEEEEIVAKERALKLNMQSKIQADKILKQAHSKIAEEKNQHEEGLSKIKKKHAVLSDSFVDLSAELKKLTKNRDSIEALIYELQRDESTLKNKIYDLTDKKEKMEQEKSELKKDVDSIYEKKLIAARELEETKLERNSIKIELENSYRELENERGKFEKTKIEVEEKEAELKEKEEKQYERKMELINEGERKRDELIKSGEEFENEVKRKAQEQAEKITLEANERSEDIVNKMREESQNILEKSRQEAASLTEKVKKESEKLINDTKLSCEIREKNSLEQAERTIEASKAEANNYYENRVSKADEYYSQKKNSSEEYFQKKTNEADSYHRDKTSKADKYEAEKQAIGDQYEKKKKEKADQYETRVIEKANQYEKNKKNEADSLFSSTKEKADTYHKNKLEEADKKFNLSMDELKNKSEEIVNKSKSTGENIVAQATKEAQRMLGKVNQQIKDEKKSLEEDLFILREQESSLSKEVESGRKHLKMKLEEADDLAQSIKMEATEKAATIIADAQIEEKLAKDKVQDLQKVIEEARQEAEAERNEMIEVAKKQADKMILKAETDIKKSVHESKSVIKKIEEEVEKRKVNLQIGYKESQNRLKERLKLEEQKLRKDYRKVITENLKSLFSSYLTENKSQLGNLSAFRKKEQVLKDVEHLITESLDGNTNEAMNTGVMKHLALKKETLDKEKQFYKKIGLGVGVAAALSLIIYFIGQWNISEDLANRKTASDSYLDTLEKERSQKKYYEPKQDKEYKETFYENYLYTKSFPEFFRGEFFQDSWIIDLSSFLLDDLELDENSIVRYMSEEAKLFSDFSELYKKIEADKPKQGIEALRLRENSFNQKVTKIFDGSYNFSRYLKFRKKFYQEKVREWKFHNRKREK
ncbi:FHA domain-containing protein [Bacteriovoracaceae bacterium]|nr:FHA domain-containing protein [Bacteriovoracaceae bacterium]